ncbi:MAG: cyclic pyranopterin monophosphate synthase MoaC [Gemmatimonadaceae bacterium]
MTESSSLRLSHVTEVGEASMVDVSSKAETVRLARAGGSIRMRAETLRAILAAEVKKGDVLGVARIAGVMAAKRTADLIPLCHPLSLTDVQVELTPDDSLPGIRVVTTVRTTGRTGVEMEALTAASVSLLTIYDMAKAIDREMEISGIVVLEKLGGASGHFQRPNSSAL